MPKNNIELEAFVSEVESALENHLKVPSKVWSFHEKVKELNLDKSSDTEFNNRTNKIYSKGNTFNLSIGQNSIRRSHLILDTFIKAIEVRGHLIINKKSKTYIVINDEELQIRFWEKTGPNIETDPFKFKVTKPSGKLYFQYMADYGSAVKKEWGDTDYSKLEDKLGRVIGSLEYIGKKEHEERLERQAYWQEQREKEAMQKELNARKQTEFNNFKSYLYCW